MADMVEVAATFINDEEKYIEDGSSIKEALEVRVGNDMETRMTDIAKFWLESP